MSLTDFSLAEPIGTGATGRVYRAVHRATGISVALKTLRPDQPLEALSLERELAAFARLDHPGILHLYDHGIADPGTALPVGTHWMALELASDGSLDDWIPTAWSEAEARLNAVLGALAHAHARGLVHRDLKPANLVRCGPMDLRPGLKIADFGLAWAVRQDTAGMVRAGSPAFMPPEQIRGDIHKLGPGSDLYALACVAWLWTTGLPPFDWLEVQPALRAHQFQKVGAFRPRFAVPDGLEALLRALLAKDPDDRPPTASHVLRALQDLEDPGALSRRPLAVPMGWRSEQTTPSTSVLNGVGLALFSLRDPPVVGREAVQDQLWAMLRSAADNQRPAAVALTGPVGGGRRRVARWLRERATELGCATVGDENTERATHGPVIVDLTQVADAQVIERVGSVLLDPAAAGPLVMLVRRTEALEGLHGYSEIALPPVPAAVIADFAQEHLGLARGAAEIVAAGAQGSPGIAVAWVRGWISGDLLRPTAEGFKVAVGADLGAPIGLDNARRLQLDGVLAARTDPERLALALGALLGTEVRAREWLPLLQRLGLDRRHSPVRALTRADLIDPTPSGWQIRDPAVQVALLDELDRHGERTRFHAAAAEVLHTLRATPDRTDREGRHRMAAGDLDGAWEVLSRALDQRREEGQWTEIRAIVELLTSRTDMATRPAFDRYTAAYFETLAVTNLVSPQAAVPAVRRLLALTPSLEPDYAQRVYRLAVEVLALAGHAAEARWVLEHTDNTQIRMRRIRAMLYLGEGETDKAISAYRALWSESPEAKFANGLGIAYATAGDPEEAERWFLRCKTTSGFLKGFVPLCNLALMWLLAGQAARALPWAHAAEAHVAEGTIVHRGFVAVVATIVAAANHDRALLERLRQRALFHVHRLPAEDPDHLLMAVAAARALALEEHRSVLDQLAARIRSHSD